MSSRKDSRTVIAAVLITLAALSWVPHNRGASHDSSGKARKVPIPLLSALPVLADLDGDHAADSINLHSIGFAKTIGIKFANLRISEFSFAATSVDRGALIARDIDGDGDLDLIWVAGRDKTTAVVLINDGRGDFTRAQDNAPYESQLNALVNSSDPSDQHSLQAGHQMVSLTSPSFPDVALTSADVLVLRESNTRLYIPFNGLGSRSAFLSYLHKRGPPAIFS